MSTSTAFRWGVSTTLRLKYVNPLEHVDRTRLALYETEQALSIVLDDAYNAKRVLAISTDLDNAYNAKLVCVINTDIENTRIAQSHRITPRFATSY